MFDNPDTPRRERQDADRAWSRLSNAARSGRHEGQSVPVVLGVRHLAVLARGLHRIDHCHDLAQAHDLVTAHLPERTTT